jgi:PBP1b-binding outer membrane lipoprotein LpoB
MKKLYLLLLLLLFLTGCASTKIEHEYSLKDDINKSIVEDFYYNDTINKKIYLLK